ncbi:hypothetical protein DFH08DRAFT_833940 [Mycena albidolilacea]|uniref:Uncharacterized protein n=1 Tax=Mycena albidolilacea TaxID=1033008 RepID=A0AAD7AR80_9AGAR|nr:hypothetical protein DFH08DRAFT_833940 [Mycena albidolilacea]
MTHLVPSNMHSAVLSRPTKCSCIYGMRTCSHNPLLRIISMSPVQDQSQLDGDLARLTPFIECNNNSRMSTCTIVFVALLLVFYALALWDRWLNLKLRESQMLAVPTTARFYGATQDSSVRSRSPDVTSVALSDGTGNKKLSPNAKGSHLAPPIIKNSSPMPCL